VTPQPVAICKLCLKRKPLVRSHLNIPSGIYSLCSDSTQTHIFISSKIVMHSSREPQDCIPKLARQDGSFPFFDMLEKVSPLVNDKGRVAFGASNNPEINIEKLTHFALGVFWKASVHSWSGTEREPLIDLGPYGDKVRRFLRGEERYPDHISLLVMVPPRDKHLVAVARPFRGSAKGCHNFLFYIPGIEFSLYVGKGISREAKLCCFYSGAPHLIMIHDVSKKISEYGLRAASTAHKSRRILATYST